VYSNDLSSDAGLLLPESVKLNVFIKGSAVSSHLNNRDYETDYPLIAVKPDLVSKPDTVP